MSRYGDITRTPEFKALIEDMRKVLVNYKEEVLAAARGTRDHTYPVGHHDGFNDAITYLEDLRKEDTNG